MLLASGLDSHYHHLKASLSPSSSSRQVNTISMVTFLKPAALKTLGWLPVTAKGSPSSARMGPKPSSTLTLCHSLASCSLSLAGQMPCHLIKASCHLLRALVLLAGKCHYLYRCASCHCSSHMLSTICLQAPRQGLTHHYVIASIEALYFVHTSQEGNDFKNS